MWKGKITIIIICCLVHQHQCDNRLNDRYNRLVNSDNFNLKKTIDSELPKQSKFFDMNDFDCKFICFYDKLHSTIDDLLLQLL